MLAVLVVHADGRSTSVAVHDRSPSASVSPRTDEPLFEFDIPTLPLTAALDRFASISGRSALYSSALVAGRTASAVHGRYTAADALALILEGTGLALEEVRTGSLVALILNEDDMQSAATAGNEEIQRASTYDTLIQAEIWKGLCADSHIALTEYRALLRFEIDAAGRLDRVRLLSSTGDANRDAALLSAVSKVQLDHAPPPELAQPLTVLILPPQQGGPACRSEASNDV